MKEKLLASTIFEIIKRLVLAIPKSINNFRFKRFFGKNAINSNQVYLVLDPYEHPQSRQQAGLMNRFVKRFHNLRPDIPIVGEDKLLGSCSVRVVKYGSSEFGLYREKVNPIQTVLDEEVIKNWKGSFICFGSSDSNIKTFQIENLPENSLYKFGFNDNGYRCFNVLGNEYSISPEGDVGILLRMKNPFHPEHRLFICAGIGEWGTSGSAYYLFNNWKSLYKKYKSDNNFIILIRVESKSDESVRIITEYHA